jgi:hypothetical protein
VAEKRTIGRHPEALAVERLANGVIVWRRSKMARLHQRTARSVNSGSAVEEAN